jgi:hypothetical protein
VSLRIPSRLAWQVIDGEAVLIDLAHGKSLGLNPAGTFVWSLLATQHDEASIAERVAERFDTSPEKVHGDVSAFLAALVERGLLITEG